MRPLVLAIALLAACGGGSDDDGSGGPGDDGGQSRSDGGSDSSDAAPGADAAPASAECQDYCATIMDECRSGDVRQYADSATCLATCAVFAPGAAGAESGNTLACRLTHLDLAIGEPAAECQSAGPSGGGVCGTYCEAYCFLAGAICPDIYASDDECTTACADFAVSGMYSTLQHNTDTVDCRIFHTTLASEDPVVHCKQADSDSNPCTE